MSVISVTEVVLARAPRALEGEVKGGSSLEGAGKGRLWRKGSRKGVDRGAQRVDALLSHLCKPMILRRPSSRTTPTALLTKTATVSMELLGGQECRAKMTSLHYFSMPLILYPA